MPSTPLATLSDGASGLNCLEAINAAINLVLPYPGVDLDNGNQTEAFDVDAVGKMFTDRDVDFGTTLRVFLPPIGQVVDANGSIMIRSCRQYAAGGFAVYPHWNDITGYWGRLFANGANLAQFSLYALEAGHSCVLTPRLVNQTQIFYGDDAGTFAVGDIITGGDSSATGEVVYVDPVAKLLQLRNVSGTFLNEEGISAPGGGEGALIRNPIACPYMWETDLVTGGFADLDDNWYWNWY